MMRIDILERKEEILTWIDNDYTKAEICRELKCKENTLNSYLLKMNIKYSGNQGGKNRKYGIKKKSIEYLYNGSTISSHKLKNKLIEEGIKNHMCEECGRSEWLGNKIPIELHHVDGNSFNNELVNLQILCPNCHALTDNYSGRNAKGSGVKLYKKDKCECGNDKTLKAKICKECNYKKRGSVKNIKKCKCGEEIHKHSKMCRKCSQISNRKVERPLHKQLITDIENLGYCGTGRKYGVSDNSIRKWLKNY